MLDKKRVTIDIFEKISDLDFQKDVWVDGKYWDRVTFFTEAVCLLDDYEFFEDVKSQRLMFQDSLEQEYLLLFITELLNYKEPRKVKSMFKDIKWLSIVEKAKILAVRLENLSFLHSVLNLIPHRKPTTE